MPVGVGPGTIYGELWVVPQTRFYSGTQLECTGNSIKAKSLVGCCGVYEPTTEFAAEVWAAHITSVGNASGELVKQILKSVSYITNNHIVSLLTEFKYLEQKFVSVHCGNGWAYGVEVTLQADDFRRELVFVGRVLLHVLREKAVLNQIVGLRILDRAGHELMFWPVEVIKADLGRM